MSRFGPRITAVTLAVQDFGRSVAFYESLGFPRRMRETGDAIAFFDAGGVMLALWHADLLAEDAAVASDRDGYGGVTLAWNCETPAEVDAVFERVRSAGAEVLRAPAATDYGGYRGYFSDPDGHVWEVVHAPFAFTADGRLVLPD